jgi:membrane protein implicated in regulation of membrane protease activity
MVNKWETEECDAVVSRCKMKWPVANHSYAITSLLLLSLVWQYLRRIRRSKNVIINAE